MELSDLCGKHILSGIERGVVQITRYSYHTDDANYTKFCLDGVNYMALEDPDDGYRSYLTELYTVDEPCQTIIPPTEVLGVMEDDTNYGKMDVLRFIDIITSKVVLRVGTADTDDYYPYCVQEWIPENLACNIGLKEE